VVKQGWKGKPLILLSVLGVLGILYVMVVQLSADVSFTAEYYHKLAFKERSYYMARSAYVGVLQLLVMENAESDSLDDQWAQEIPPYHFPSEQVYLRVKIEDQERFFNPNSIYDGEKEDDKHLSQFRRLLGVLQLEKDYSNTFLDWMDTDEQRRMPLGAEGTDYMETGSKGGRLDSLEEIKQIKGINDEAYRGRVSMGQGVPGLRDVLSIYTNGKVNVNTAGKEVLMSLDEEVTEELAMELIRRREGNAFTKMDDLLDLPGMNSDLLYRMKQLSDVKSENFKITITVEDYQKESEELVVIAKRSGNSGQVVFWKAN
jgi:general secretion pathway protein K